MLLNITGTRMSDNLHALLFLATSRPLGGLLKIRLDKNLIKIEEMMVTGKEGLVLVLSGMKIGVKDAPELEFVYDIPYIEGKGEAYVSIDSLTDFYDNNRNVNELLQESIASVEKSNTNYSVYSKPAIKDTIESSIEALCAVAASKGKVVVSHNVVPIGSTTFLVTVLAK